MKKTNCPKCGSMIIGDIEYCHCGYKINSYMMADMLAQMLGLNKKEKDILDKDMEDIEDVDM